MSRRAGGRWAAVLVLLLGSAGDAAAEGVAVARSSVRTGTTARAAGLVFFLAVSDEVGAAAVGAAHSFDLAEVAASDEVEFRLGARGQRVAVSSRLLVPPGRAFHLPGSSLRQDFLVFALDARPVGVRVLEAREDPPRTGERVRLLGIPAVQTRDEDDLFGTVVRADAERVEVDLDTPADLRGWGGAPLLSAEDGRVLGVLQAAWPSAQTLRLGAGPIAGVLEALRRPLAGGLGQPFADFAETAAASGAVPRPPPPPAAGARPAAPAPSPPPAPRREVAKGARGDEAKKSAAAQDDAPEGVRVRLEVEYPEDGAVIGSSQGAFLAGRAVALVGEIRPFDVILVIDTSGSTAVPTGVDVNDNGVVGKPPLGGFGRLFGLGTNDPGDSVLAAEVAAARRLLQGLDPRNTRVGLVTFAGDPNMHTPGVLALGRGPQRMPAVTEEPLTTDYERIARALDRVLERGAEGMTHMAAGVDQATIELLGLRGSFSKPLPDSEKIVLFFTDGQPTLPYDGFTADNVRAVLRAADRAHRAAIRIHSFAIGPEALDGPIATIEMAAITEGLFTPVRHPGELVSTIEGVSFANIEEVTVRNLTTESRAHAVQTNADGSFEALVPLAAGKNRIEVSARASEGTQKTVQLMLHYAPGAEDPPVAPELVAQRNRLLEQRLIELRRGRLDSERERAEEVRRQLRLEIERERAVAAERAARQRKELELEVEAGAEGRQAPR